MNKTLRLQFLTILLYALIFNACDISDEPSETSAEEMAGNEIAAGEIAGTETSAGEMAGTETTGTEMAGTETAGAEVAGIETAGTEISMQSPCQSYCTYLEDCGSCLQDEAGECVDIDTCTSTCETEVPELASACISRLSACDEEAFTACYDQTIGDDDCARACVLLEECDQCFVDENDECLTLAGCAATCRELTPPEVAACLGATDQCEAIDACFE